MAVAVLQRAVSFFEDKRNLEGWAWGLTGHSGMSRGIEYTAAGGEDGELVPASCAPTPHPHPRLTRSSEGSTGTQPCQSLGRREWSAGDTGPDGTEGTRRGGTESLGWGESARARGRTLR